jgi:hypothetical protein
MVIMVQLVLYMTNMQNKKVNSQTMPFVAWLKRILSTGWARKEKPAGGSQERGRVVKRLDGLESRVPYDSTNLRWRGGAL